MCASTENNVEPVLESLVREIKLSLSEIGEFSPLSSEPAAVCGFEGDISDAITIKALEGSSRPANFLTTAN